MPLLFYTPSAENALILILEIEEALRHSTPTDAKGRELRTVEEVLKALCRDRRVLIKREGKDAAGN